MNEAPIYPLRVAFDDGDEWVLDTSSEVALSLEWFDSDDSEVGATVTDANGRTVRLKVVGHILQLCEVTGP